MEEHNLQAQRQNFADALEKDLLQQIEDESSSSELAFSLVALRYLEFDPDEGIMPDGAGDYGIDYGIIGEDEASIFQFKCHDYTQGLNQDFKIGPDDLGDLRRIKEILSDLDRIPKKANLKLKQFILDLRDSIRELKIRKEETDELVYKIEVKFVALASGFSPQARDEYSKIILETRYIYDKIPIYVSYGAQFLDDLIESKWRQTNTDWKDKSGRKHDNIEITVAGKDNDFINNSKWCIFFGKAFDLVNAFKTLGYRIFEPNVRCELKTSKINRAIKDSVSSNRGRKEFMHLNNGITISCDTFTKPTENKRQIKIMHPGIINGLQTVKSLYDAYKLMESKDKTDFEENCHVLIRVHTKDSVKDINELIKATNNQNPMKPRNLRSNEAEQISYQTLLGKHNWFYARKEREWEAFSSDPRAWRRLEGKKKASFKGISGYKKADNQDIAQAYFSFIGFTTEAMNKKKQLFDDDDLYEIIFKKRISKPGKEYDLSFSKNKANILSESESSSPSPETLLISHILLEVAKNLSTPQSQLRQQAVSRLSLENKTADEIKMRLKDDTEYIKGYVIRGTLFIFIEFVGYILFRSFKEKFDTSAARFFDNCSMKSLFLDYDFETLKNRVQGNKYDNNDLIVIYWKLYEEIIDDLISDPMWLNRWKAETNVSRFHYSEENRKRILDRVDDYDSRAVRRELMKDWSVGIDQEKGLYKFVRKVLS
jgi:hypothetical protein